MAGQQDAEEIGRAAAIIVARFWWAEAKKIEEQINDPTARWEIMVQALHRVGWPDHA